MTDLSQFHPDLGVDRKQLKKLKHRFIQLSEERLERTRQAIGVRQQLFLDVLPLLLHVNHPMLPGYNGAETPSGIPYFRADELQLSAARMIARSFSLKKDLSQRELAVDALFLMGSVGSIAHSGSSDFDIWVCHKPNLTKASLNQLQKKCEDISKWADKELSVEAHFFLVNTENANTVSSSDLSTESSGSAQQHLLLDEFYRSAIWVAGKTPLWWFVPTSSEENYEYFAQQLLRKRFIRKQDIVDFGPITHIPLEEYLGAGIWQLYKGISAPHKSILKLLLLEAYALAPQPRPLALDFKELVQTKAPDANAADSYLLIYRRIESYLKQSQNVQRLELARRCFYFKVNKPLSRPPSRREKSWQRILLESLIDEWQWDKSHVLRLDSHRLWKANQVMQERELLVKELSKSYRLLGGLSHRSFQDAKIASEEMRVLGRKLHAAFERKSGKIERINPDISKDLSEAFLTIRPGKSNASEWLLYRGKFSESNTESSKNLLVKQGSSLFEVMLWCLWNGVLDRRTNLDIFTPSSPSSAQRQKLVATLSSWLEEVETTPAHDDFLEPARISHVFMAVNVTQSPYLSMQEKGLVRLSENNDALNYSGLHDNLVNEVDMAYLNTWQELLSRQHNRNALAESLMAYLRFAPPHIVKEPPELVICCPDVQFGGLIEKRLEQLYASIRRCFYGKSGNSNARFIFETHQKYYIVQFQQGHPRLTSSDSVDGLLEPLELPQLIDRPVVLDDNALVGTSLRAIIEYTDTGSNYLFYEFVSDEVWYTYVDESSAILRFSAKHMSDRAFPSQTVDFINTVSARLSSQGEAFALEHFDRESIGQPVFVQQLLPNSNDFSIVARPAPTEISLPQSLDIKVYVTPAHDGGLEYSIVCDDSLYDASQGDPFKLAAEHIRRSRDNVSAAYHCYISDLDLTACSDLLAPETGLTLIHYLREKRSIESKLNQASQH